MPAELIVFSSASAVVCFIAIRKCYDANSDWMIFGLISVLIQSGLCHDLIQFILFPRSTELNAQQSATKKFFLFDKF